MDWITHVWTLGVFELHRLECMLKLESLMNKGIYKECRITVHFQIAHNTAWEVSPRAVWSLDDTILRWVFSSPADKLDSYRRRGSSQRMNGLVHSEWCTATIWSAGPGSTPD
jgi:hypothetical protein